jgi:hypothetical protein
MTDFSENRTKHNNAQRGQNVECVLSPVVPKVIPCL